MKPFLAVLLVVFACTAIQADAKGGGGGRSSARSVSRPAPSHTAGTSKPVVAPTPKPVKVAPKIHESATPVKSASGKNMSTKGKVLDNDKKFSGRYSAPAGSVVYYPQHSFMDYLPWIFLFTMDSKQTVVVQEPSGEQKTVQEEGVDTMYVINWIVSILLLGGIIGFIMWLVNKKREKSSSRGRDGTLDRRELWEYD